MLPFVCVFLHFFNAEDSYADGNMCLYNEKDQVRNSYFGVSNVLSQMHADVIDSANIFLKGKITGLIDTDCHI